MTSPVPDPVRRGLSPVRPIDTDDDAPPAPGIGLCLSGGGYRAMVFHVGALWRLNEAGMLPRLDRISSVSGGSIVAALLGLAWPRLAFDASGVARGFRKEVVAPLRRMASTTVDIDSVVLGIASPGSVNDRLADDYRAHLFGDATLQDLPDRPRIVLNATSLQTAELFRFSKTSAADWRVGALPAPRIPLAVAVAASSAFPPFLSPAVLHPRQPFVTEAGNTLASPPYRDTLVLADGGVYDNLGLETVWKRLRTVLVSDAGGEIAPDPTPPRPWPLQIVRVLQVLDHQVRSLRKHQAIGAFAAGIREGAYWGIRSEIAKYPAEGALPCPPQRTARLAAVPTRLAAMDDVLQERLVNWGYAITDAALRAHVDPAIAPPAGFPYPAAAV